MDSKALSRRLTAAFSAAVTDDSTAIETPLHAMPPGGRGQGGGKGTPRQVWLVFVLYICLAIVDAVLFKLTWDSFGESYSFFVNQFYSLFFVLLATAGYQVVKRTRAQAAARPGASLHKQFFTMGCLDASGNCFGSMGAVRTPGSLQVLLRQLQIPFSMIASYLYLKVKVGVKPMIGAAVIVLGVIIATIPDFRQHSDTSVAAYAILIFTASTIPNSFSLVYKEGSFDKDNTDAWHMAMWVSLWQFLLGWLYLPLLSLKVFGGIALKDMPTNLSQGFQCWLGHNSQDGDNCTQTTFWLFLIYALESYFYNVAYLYVAKRGSAVLGMVATAVRLPMVTLLFSLKFVMGSHYEPFSGWTIVGLLVVLAGFLVYKLSSREFAEPTPQERAQSTATTSSTYFVLEPAARGESSPLMPASPRSPTKP